jgi:hypothetical protein
MSWYPQRAHNASVTQCHIRPPASSPQTQSLRPTNIGPTQLEKSLISLGQLCNHGCDYVLLEKHYTSAIKDGVTSVIGLRDSTNGMWLVDIEPSGEPTPIPTQHPTYQHQTNSAYEQKTKVQLIEVLHRACFKPLISTWTQAIEKNFFATWPGLTADNIRKYLPKSLATAKGHLKSTPKNIRSMSTKCPAIAQTEASTVMMMAPSKTEPPVQTHLVYAKVIAITGQIYSDQTGRFPVTLSKGNKYIMIDNDYDSTAILAEPIKNQSEQEILCAYSKMHQYLTGRRLKPQLQKA